MIKLFISQPMKGKTDEEILAVREKAIQSAKDAIGNGEDVDVIDSFFQNAPAGSIEKEINEVCERKKIRGRTITGYNVWSKETMLLFESISDGKYLIRGFTNKDIRSSLYPQKPDDPQNRGRMSRTFAKLRAHGLIRRVPHSRRYLVTDKGRRIIGALIETKRKIYPGLAAS